MSDAPEVTQGPAVVGGQSDQPLKGQAGETNAAIQAIPQPEPVPALQTATPDTSMQPLHGDSGQHLFGPTGRPDEPVTAGGQGYVNTTPPDNAHEWMPALVEAAKDPSAPQEVKDLLAIVTHLMGS